MTDDNDRPPVSRPSAEGARERRQAHRQAMRRGKPPRRGPVGWFASLPLWARFATGVPAVLVVAGLLAVLVDLAVATGRIHPGVELSGIPVGMLTPTQAELRLDKELETRLKRPVVATYGESTWTVTAEDIAIDPDTRASARKAYEVGRTDGVLAMLADRFEATFSGIDLTVISHADEGKMSELLDEMEARLAKPAKDARVLIEGTDARLVPSAKGVGLRRTRARDDLLAAFASTRRTVQLHRGPVRPHVTDADAKQALADAREMMSDSVTVQYEDRTWAFEPSTIASWIVFQTVPYREATATAVSSAATSVPPGAQASPTTPSAEPTAVAGDRVVERMKLRATLDQKDVSDSVLPLAGGIGKPPVNAKFVVSGGRVSVTGGKAGSGPDIPTLVSDLNSAMRKGGDRHATLQLATLQPDLTAEKAQQMGIVGRISTYTTNFDSSAKQRVNNIQTLAAALDDKLVPPGGVFDFNAAVGERTAAKGYQEAPAIVNGKLVPQLGGGICQIGTTFFNSVFFAGLPVVERKNHSFYISHYPKGRDCTISWGGPNFRWKNDTPNWILIKTASSRSSVTISLYGTDPRYEVSYSTSAFSNVRPHPVKEVKDPTLAVGARVREEGGVDGGTVTVVRTVKGPSGEVVRKDRFVSYYSPKEEIVRVGTKAVTKPATTTPAP